MECRLWVGKHKSIVSVWSHGKDLLEKACERREWEDITGMKEKDHEREKWTGKRRKERKGNGKIKGVDRTLKEAREGNGK